MHSNKYILIYAAAVTSLIGASLALTVEGLKERQNINALEASRRAILQTVMEVDTAAIERQYRTYIQELVYNHRGDLVDGVSALSLNLREESRKPLEQQLLPVFIFSQDGKRRFVIPMRGTGLWGPIGAYLAMEADLSTVYGIAFSHEKETPGLGAEIDTPEFGNRFRAKKILGEDGNLAPIAVLKGSGANTANMPHAVDGLTGATATLDGVTAMFRSELERYATVFTHLRRANQ